MFLAVLSTSSLLPVPVQVIDWKDTSPEWHNVLMGTLNLTHSLSAYRTLFTYCR